MVTARSRARTKRRRELRAEVFALDDNRCRWPHCGKPAVELAHCSSVGMGGRASADVASNCFAACWDHARASDGLYSNRAWYVNEVALLGIQPPYKAWKIAEALREHIAKGRP